MANEFIARKGIKALADSQITGSLNISQNIVAGGTVQAVFASSTSTAISGAFVSVSESFASSRLKNTTDTLTGDLTVTGTITAQEFHTEFVSASILYDSGSTKFGNSADDAHQFTGSLLTTGNVGIGTTSPSKKLHIKSDDNEGIFMEGTGGGHWFNFKSGTSNLWSMGAQTGLMGWYNRTDSTYKMVITDAGNVGIGTTAPAAKFQISSGDNTGTQLLIGEGSEYGAPSIRFVPAVTNYMGIGFTTGSTVGNEVLDAISIQRTGNVGIGVTSPQAKLHSSAAYPTYTDAGVVFYGGTTNNDSRSGISLISYGDALGGYVGSNLLMNGTTFSQTNTARASGYIQFINSTTAGVTADIAFGGLVKGGTSLVERMRITSDGKVGIGTAPGTWSIGTSLQIGTTTALWYYSNGTYLTTNRIYNSGNKYIVNGYSTSYEQGSQGQHIFLTAPSGIAGASQTSTAKMVILNNGNVGIGTTVPSYPLHVIGSRILVEDSNAGIMFRTGGADRYSVASVDGNFQVYDEQGGGNRLLITSEGYLATSTSGTTVNNGDLLGVISFASRDASTYSSGGVTNIRSYATEDYNSSFIGGDLRFYTSDSTQNTTGTYLFGTERMSIGSTGHVTIENRLFVKNSQEMRLGSMPTQYPYRRLDSFEHDGSGYFWGFGTKYGATQKINAFFVGQARTFHAVDSLAVVQWTANEYNGSYPSYSVKAQIDADGIKFNGDTSSANALDDYEEGTWTPRVERLTSNPTVSYSYREGTYTKIGNMVYVFFDMSISSNSGGSGTFIIEGLPYTVSSNQAGYSVTNWRDSGAITAGGTGGQLKGFVNKNTTYIYPQIDNSGTSGFGFQGTPDIGTGRITGCVYYHI